MKAETYNEIKSVNYLELVQKAQKRYENPKTNGKIILTGLGSRCGGCHEINLYTYWQGLGYAEDTPKIKYLLVGQDWGSLNDIGIEFAKRIEKINQNINRHEPYIVRNSKENFLTDENLIRLFMQLGYDDNKAIDKQRHKELFFTNFCLGYRIEKTSGNMNKKFMEQDKDLFIELCNILEPENILCLGKLTFQCVYESLTGEKACKLEGFSGAYNAFIENHREITAKCGTKDDTKIYPLAHCGGLGTRNRCFEHQLVDWNRIGN